MKLIFSHSVIASDPFDLAQGKHGKRSNLHQTIACRGLLQSFHFLAMTLFILTSCGGSFQTSGGNSALAVKITSAKSFNPSINHGRIEKYRVTITGNGIDAPLSAEFSGDATEGTIDNVPTGDDRTVSVEAINPNSATIRAGEAEGVSVGGGINEVEVALEAVPIFTNLADGNTIDNTRLVFKIFSDPKNSVEVAELKEDAALPLIDPSINSAEINLNQSTGVGQLAPLLIASGEHIFTVRDTVTGRLSKAQVILVDGTKRKPAPVVSATELRSNIKSCSAPWCIAGRK